MWYLIIETRRLDRDGIGPLTTVVYGDDVYHYDLSLGHRMRGMREELIVFSLQSHGVKRREEKIEKHLLAQERQGNVL